MKTTFEISRKNIANILVLYFGLLLPFIGSNSLALFAQNAWVQKADFGGNARFFATGFSIGTKAFIGTGKNSYINYKDFWEWNQTTNTWTQKADFGGTSRCGAVGFSIGSKGYIGTGIDSSNTEYKDLWEYNPSTNIWTQKADFGGLERYAAVGFSIGNKGYIACGGNYNTSITAYQDFWEWDQSNNTWTKKTDVPGSARVFATGFSIAKKGYVGTGGLAGSSTRLSDFYEWDQATNVWTQKADMAGGARDAAIGFSISNKGYIGTGRNTSSLNDFWEWDQNSDTWIQKNNFGGVARSFAVGFAIGSKGYIGTGTNGGSTFYKDFWEFQSCTTPTPTITASGPTTLCSTSTVTLTSSTAYSYSWSNGAITKSITISTPGDYFVTTSDSTGCSASSNTISVTDKVNAFATSDPLTLCGGSGTVQLLASSGASFSDNFDPILSSQWSVMDGISSNDCGSVSGNALYFNGISSSRSAATKDMNTSAGGTVTFYLKIGTGSSPCETADPGDEILLEFSNNGGTSWTTITTYNTGTTYQDFTLITTPIPTGAKTTNTRFRWTQPSSSGTGYDNWAIDNVSITSGSTGNYTYSWSPSSGLSSATIANPTATLSSTKKYSVTITEVSSSCKDTASVTIVVKTSTLTASITPGGDTTLCSNNSLILTATQGSAYLWSNGSVYQSITVYSAGTYKVTVTDPVNPDNCKGQAVSAPVVVTTKSSPTVTITPATANLCSGDSVKLTASTSNNYYWSNGKTTQSIYVKNQGYYSVTITDVSGCTAYAYANVSNTQSTYASATPSSACLFDTVQLNTSNNSTFFDDFEYSNNLWYSNYGNRNMTCGSVSGYSLYFNSSMSRFAITKDLDVLSGGTISFYLKIASGTTSPCEATEAGEDVLLRWSKDGGANWTTLSTYLAGTSTYQNFTLLSVAIPAAAMSSTTRFQWIQLSHSGSNNDNWALDNVTITSNNYTYSWSPTSGLSNSNISNPTAVIMAPTTYSVTVTNTTTGCKGTSSVYINMNSGSSIASIYPSGPTTFCTGGSVNLYASSGSSYLWSNSSVSSSINVTTSGNYTVTVTNPNGCKGVSVSKPVTVNVTTVPTAVITPPGPIEICSGNTVRLYANSGSSWSWSNGTNSQNLYVFQPGTYSVTITNAGGCTGSAVSNLVTVTTSVQPSKPTITRKPSSLVSSSMSNNQWFKNSDPITNANSQEYFPSVTGVYSVAVGNINGCFTMSDTAVFYYYYTQPGGVSEVSGKKLINIFPNPNTGSFTVETGELKGKQIKIFNILGKVLYSEQINNSGNHHTISFKNYPSGVYILLLQTDDKIYHSQFIKE